jgi:glycosyltransferase involved in cell wall biosynthesis
VERLRRLDLVLFPSTGGHYEATASGTLLDCAAAGVPVAASASGLLSSLEQEAGGALGPQLETGPAAAALDALTAAWTDERRAAYARALRRLRESRSAPRTAERLARMLGGREAS